MANTEHTLVKNCLKGDRNAQRQLYEQYKVSMYNLCLRYAKDKDEAKDFLQEGFITVFKDLHQYTFSGALGGWIRRVIVNVALQHIRRNKKNIFTDVSLEHISDTYADNQKLFSRYREKAILKMVQDLPDGFRVVFNMYVIEGYSHKEIADQLNISVNTSKSQLSRAKAALRKKLEQQIAL